MRTFSILATLGVLVLPAVLVAKGPPPPTTCPPDVAAAIAAACPCDGATNHGQHVSCVVQQRNALRKGGCLTTEDRRTIARCAARSTCGKPGRVICCLANGKVKIAPDETTCMDRGGTSAGQGSICGVTCPSSPSSAFLDD